MKATEKGAVEPRKISDPTAMQRTGARVKIEKIRSSSFWAGLVSQIHLQILLRKKKISHHIKIPIHI
jgi:hypothetical protein